MGKVPREKGKAAYELFFLGIEYYWGMQEKRLSPTHLWQVVRSLSEPEAAEVGKQTAGTRLEWLYLTLREMETYREADLKAAYARRFPGKDPRLLRVYKRQLWDIVEAVLAQSPLVHEEVRIWQRFWASVVLWQRAEITIAETLWWQAFSSAVEKGWYEVALWGLFLLEQYARDLHKFAPSVSVEQWAAQLTDLLKKRYTALQQKFSETEQHVESRLIKGWTLPSLPESEGWALYFDRYAALLRAAGESDHLKALSETITLVELLEFSPPGLTATYRAFHRVLQWTNLGITLLNAQAWDWYEKWYEAWENRWNAGLFLVTPRTTQLYQSSQAIQLGYLVSRAQWEAAYQLWRKHKKDLYRYVFESAENIGSRLGTACSVYTVLVLSHSEDMGPWRRQVEEWIEREQLRERELVWWRFLRWYEAYRFGERSWMRHTLKKLRETWQRHFRHDERWRPILRLAGALLLPTYHYKRYLRLLALRWEKHPQEKSLWFYDASLFPLPNFLESLRQGIVLEAFRASAPPPTALPPALTQRLTRILYSDPDKKSP
ncbi:MAG: hypothetical protein D6750_05450 [Bacteroidetes bacterium]|nr:MAG: hypothetical protein D6750_05450 [Bacteroidota bacterium]